MFKRKRIDGLDTNGHFFIEVVGTPLEECMRCGYEPALIIARKPYPSARLRSSRKSWKTELGRVPSRASCTKENKMATKSKKNAAKVKSTKKPARTSKSAKKPAAKKA